MCGAVSIKFVEGETAAEKFLSYEGSIIQALKYGGDAIVTQGYGGDVNKSLGGGTATKEFSDGEDGADIVANKCGRRH